MGSFFRVEQTAFVHIRQRPWICSPEGTIPLFLLIAATLGLFCISELPGSAADLPCFVGWVRSVRANDTATPKLALFCNSAKRPDWVRSVVRVENRIRLSPEHVAPE